MSSNTFSYNPYSLTMFDQPEESHLEWTTRSAAYSLILNMQRVLSLPYATVPSALKLLDAVAYRVELCNLISYMSISIYCLYLSNKYQNVNQRELPLITFWSASGLRDDISWTTFIEATTVFEAFPTLLKILDLPTSYTYLELLSTNWSSGHFVFKTTLPYHLIKYLLETINHSPQLLKFTNYEVFLGAFITANDILSVPVDYEMKSLLLARDTLSFKTCNVVNVIANLFRQNVFTSTDVVFRDVNGIDITKMVKRYFGLIDLKAVKKRKFSEGNQVNIEFKMN